MNTYAIMFNACTNSSWKMNWNPTQTIDATEADVLTVVDYIKNGVWSADASATAKKCYDTIAEHIAETIVDDAFADQLRAQVLMMVVKHYYDNNKLSTKGRLLYERQRATSDINAVKKLFKKIIKNEKIYGLVIDETRAWSDEELSLFECCICGTPITDEEGHNPYPVRPTSWYGERENRCCGNCNYRIVIPARLRFGRYITNNHNPLMKMDYDELLDVVA